MRLAKPKLYHSPEVYLAIVREHGGEALRLARRLEHLGWSMADAAWVAVNWELTWLAAAVANTRVERGLMATTHSTQALAELRAEGAAGQPAAPPKPRRTNRLSKTPKPKREPPD